MGVCSSSPNPNNKNNNSRPVGSSAAGGGGRGNTSGSSGPTIKVINTDGRLQEFKQQIKASRVLSQNPNSFLCGLDNMYIDSILPHVPETDDLVLGQIYFLIPLSKSRIPLSIADLCVLAIKASSALQDKHDEVYSGKCVRYPGSSGGDGGGVCMVPIKGRENQGKEYKNVQC